MIFLLTTEFIDEKTKVQNNALFVQNHTGKLELTLDDLNFTLNLVGRVIIVSNPNATTSLPEENVSGDGY